jgi:hypothetical protein
MFTLKFYAILNNSLVRQIAVCYESEMIFVQWTSRMILGLSGIAITVTSALGDTSIAVPDFGFDTDGPSITAYGFESGNYTGGNNRYYTNQNPAGANPYPDAELFAGWVNTDTNEQAYETSTAGMSGLAMGITSAVQVNNSVGNTTVSLNPVVSSIDLNAKYTFTLSLAAGGSTSSDVTLELVSTTSASDPTNYNVPAYGNYTTSTTLTGPQSDFNPTPIITSTVLESKTITAATLNAQGSDAFQNYSVSLNTNPSGADVADAGQNLSLLIFVSHGGGTVLFTDAQLTETPEPSTWAMMLLGACGLLFVARRRLA